MIRFIHTADIHFGMENYGKIDPQTGIHSRLLDFEKALNACIDTGIAERVDFFLFCGDAYKTAQPSPTQQRLLMRSFIRLYTAGIPAIIIVGNHDHPLSFGKTHALDVFSQLPVDGFHVVAQPKIINLSTKNGPVQIVGIPWPTRNSIATLDEHMQKSDTLVTEYISKAVCTIIDTYAQKLDPHVPAVLAGHLTVSSGIFSGSEKRAIIGTDPLFLPSQLAREPFDYVALGHLHRYQNLNPKGYPAVVYSGSIERVDFGERKEDKGFCLVTIHEKNNTEHTFIKTPTRPFIQINVTITKEHGQTDEILSHIRKHNVNQAVVKILYHLPIGIPDHVDLKVIEQALSAAQYVVGIIPVKEIDTKARRPTLKVDMGMEQLLNLYIQDKPELQKKKDVLMQKIHELESEDSCCTE